MTTTGNVHESSTRQSSNEPPQAPPTGDMNGGYAFDDADEAESFAQEYQNTSFTINEYYSIGQVANLVNDNGANLINMTLTVNGTDLVSKGGAKAICDTLCRPPGDPARHSICYNKGMIRKRILKNRG